MGLYKRGDVWCICYSFQGKQYRESTGMDNKHFARDVLAKRQVEIREQRLFDVKKGAKVGFAELAEDYLRFYRERGRRSLERAETSVKHLTAFFGDKRSIASPRRRSKRTSPSGSRNTRGTAGLPVRPRSTGSWQPSVRC